MNKLLADGDYPSKRRTGARGAGGRSSKKKGAERTNNLSDAVSSRRRCALRPVARVGCSPFSFMLLLPADVCASSPVEVPPYPRLTAAARRRPEQDTALLFFSRTKILQLESIISSGQRRRRGARPESREHSRDARHRCAAAPVALPVPSRRQ